MIEPFEDVAAFHRACDVPILPRPAVPSEDRVKLRVDLVSEEHAELLKAIADNDLTEIADACADLIYVVIGTALEYGIPLPVVWDEVHFSNMAKIDRSTGKVRRRDDGKVLKPDGWVPPDIERIINDAANKL